MSTETTIEIEHKCGHAVSKDLSNIPAGDRAGRARWLASKPCFECYRKRSNRELSKEIKEERAELAAAALADQEQSRLPILTGPPKVADWGTRVRFELLRDAYAELVEAGDMDDADWEEQILERARRIHRGGWWVDNRDATIEALVEALADPGTTEDRVENENPY